MKTQQKDANLLREAQAKLNHSAAHILAEAILECWGNAQFAAGPAVEGGFYYDVQLDHQITPTDFPQLESLMRKVVEANVPFERIEIGRDEAQKLIDAGRIGALTNRVGSSHFKADLLNRIPESEPITLYKSGEFLDLCAGPHLERTGEIGAFRLTQVAQAYYQGDNSNPQLQRVYGVAFRNESELATWERQQAEAKARDHRKLGRQLGLFAVEEDVGQGLVLWLPDGAVIRQELQNFIAAELRKQGYQQVFTPHIGRLELFRTSGHFPYYRDSQFPPIVERAELEKLGNAGCSCGELCNRLDQGQLEGFLLKPMNCPMHIKIFAQRRRSYRELPVRLAEFGTVYRWEKSGELGGLTRVRGFTQDDAHLFVTPEQLEAEIEGCLGLAVQVLSTLGLNQYRVRLSLRDPSSDKYVGSSQNWEKAEAALRRAVEKLGLACEEALGEAAFYGPKVDFLVQDALGREWQLGTVQLDYNLPERFDLNYVGADNQLHRPVMIHRAPFGSMERFVGVLIEHFAGSFPFWLAPEQARVVTVSDDEASVVAAKSLLVRIQELGIRSELDCGSDPLGEKIRRAQEKRVHTVLIVGKKEAANGTVTRRGRDRSSVNQSVDAAMDYLRNLMASRSVD